MPSEMEGKRGAFSPCCFGLGEECEAIMGAALHLHHMSNDVNSASMLGIECQRATRHFLGATILSILFEGKGVHCKKARITRHRRGPSRQHLSNPISHHSRLTEVKIKSVCDCKREDVVWPVDHYATVKSDRKSRIALEPSARCGSMAACRMVDIWACGLIRATISR